METAVTDTAPKVQGGFPDVRPAEHAPPGLDRFVSAMRCLQDLTVSTNPEGSTWITAAQHVESACTLLDGHQAPEGVAPAGRVLELPGLGHPMLPPWTLTESGPEVDGRKIFISATMTAADDKLLSEANGLMVRLRPHQP
jgi:hypothetical protein